MGDDIYLTLPQPCPGCGTPNDGHFNTTGRDEPPEPGAASVCAYCCTVGIFSKHGGIRLPTPEEATELAADVGVQAAVQALRALQFQRAWAKN
jgi:hypothetical protein